MPIESQAGEDKLEASEDVATVRQSNQDNVISSAAVEVGVTSNNHLLNKEAALRVVSNFYLVVGPDLGTNK